MRKLLHILGITVALAGCRTDEPVDPAPGPVDGSGTLRVTVVPEWEGQPLQLFSEYRAPGNYRFQVEMLKFYLSDLRLVNATTEQPLEQVRLLDLGAGPFSFDFSVPEGTWYGIRGGLGLPHDLNYTNAALYPDGHPMSVNTGMYWTWATGYKFVLFDGRYNPDPAGTGPLLMPFSVHTGMDTCYTTVELMPALPFTTAKGSVTELTLRVAADGFLLSSGDTIDVATEDQSHGGNYPLALKLTRNVKRSLRLE
jgi:hypothetical protein